jgi:pyruvate ferredoxin oxidoreductase gamma subunit
MIEIRIHGRGGQGAVASAEMMAVSAIDEGKYAQAFPSFGPERRGAPVVAFLRISDQPILRREPVLNPDIVVVLDPTVLRAVKVGAGLKEGGSIAVNTCKRAEELAEQYALPTCRLAMVDASHIAQTIIGRAITNTAMLGALLKLEPLVKLESLFEQIKERFPAIADKNIKALQAAYDETVVIDLNRAVGGDK